jgi:hypothetical protein
MSNIENKVASRGEALGEVISAVGATASWAGGLSWLIGEMPIANLPFAFFSTIVFGSNSIVEGYSDGLKAAETAFIGGLGMFAVGKGIAACSRLASTMTACSNVVSSESTSPTSLSV